MIERTILLFDSSHDLLGECSVVGGFCSSIGLNARGDRLIGRSMEQLAALQHSISFMDALREWADHSDVLIVSFPAERISAWHHISSTDFSPADRYALAFAISHSSRRQQEAWQELLKS